MSELRNLIYQGARLVLIALAALLMLVSRLLAYVPRPAAAASSRQRIRAVFGAGQRATEKSEARSARALLAHLGLLSD